MQQTQRERSSAKQREAGLIKPKVPYVILKECFVVVIVVFLKKIYLFYLYEYTVAVFRHTRRVHGIPLQIVVSHHVVAWN
jgi:quinol-cytochrome oxidoreductase complex cytochrome b subunit